MTPVTQLPEADCARALALLAQAQDGALACDEAAWLESHVSDCAACRSASADFSELDGELSDWGRETDAVFPAPAGVREQLAARMIPRPRRIPLWLLPAAAALAAAIALFAVSARKPPAPVAHEDPPFVEIPYLPPLDPHENTTVVRMDVDVRTLIAAGYRVAADPNSVISADVLVGEDGRAHAIRLAPLQKN